MLGSLRKVFRSHRLETSQPRTDSTDGSLGRPNVARASALRHLEDSEALRLSQRLPPKSEAGSSQSGQVGSDQTISNGTASSTEARSVVPAASGTGFSRGHHFNPTVDVILYLENMGQRWLKAS